MSSPDAKTDSGARLPARPGRQARAWLRSRPALVAGLLALFILGGKWILVDRFSGEVPYVDQWVAEGEDVCLPILDGTWSWGRWFAPWNEHRIVPTRLLTAALFLLTGRQWDPLVETAVAAVIHVLFFGAAAYWLMRRTPAKLHAWICGLMAAAGLLPFAYENTLWGFQSHFYFMLLFALAAGWGLLGARAGTLRWGLGALAGAAAVLTTGSGGLIGGSVSAVMVLRGIKQRRWSVSDGATALVGLACLAATWLLRVEAEAHTRLVADSWLGFSLAFWRLAAWPFPTVPPLGVVVWLPCGLLFVRWLQGRLPARGSLVEGTLFVAILALAQLLALALMRATLLAFLPPASRYQELLALGVAANFMAWLVLRSLRGERWLRWAGPVWIFVLLAGLVQVSADATANVLAGRRHMMDQLRDQLALFVRVGTDPALQGIERNDALASRIKAWTGARVAALPPALQAVPPAGFGFPAENGWAEGGFATSIGPPGGYAGWGNWSGGAARPAPGGITSTPFAHVRGALVFSYAMSPHWGSCEVELLDADGHRVAGFTAGHTVGGDPQWREARLLLSPGTYRVRIRDEREEGRFAITAPREMSVAGWLARLALEHGHWLLLAGGSGLVAVFAGPATLRAGKK